MNPTLLAWAERQGNAHPPTANPNDYPVTTGLFPYTGDVYHADAVRLSSTDVRGLLKNPDKYRRKLAGEVSDRSDALDFGSLVHEVLAEADLSASEKYFVSDVEKPDGRTAAGKKVREFVATHAAGRKVVWADEYLKAVRCADRMRENETLAALLSLPGWVNDLSLQSNTPTGIGDFGAFPAKVSFDKILIREVDPNAKERPMAFGKSFLFTAIALDTKTAHDSSPWGFRNAVFDFGYHVQEQFYRRVAATCGIYVERFIYAVLGTGEGLYPACYELSSQFQEAGRSAIQKVFTETLPQVKAGVYKFLPFYSDGINELTPGNPPRVW